MPITVDGSSEQDANSNAVLSYIQLPPRANTPTSLSDLSPSELKEILASIKAGRATVVHAADLAGGSRESAARARVIDRFNSAALKVATGLSEDDKSIGRVRTTVLFVLATITILSGLSLLASVIAQSTPATIAASVSVVASIALSLLANPLQTVERDVVFRRWSDSIVGAFLVQTASYEADFPRLVAAGKQASQEFATLAASYTALTKNNSDALIALGKPAAEPEEDAAEPEVISVTNPGAQTSPSGTALSPALTIEATGPATLAYAYAGLPAGLVGDPATGEITGTPTTAVTEAVVVTVTTDALVGASVSVSFTWTVS